MLSKNISRRDDNDGEGNENVKNNNRLFFLAKQQLHVYHWHFFVHFFAVTARLRRENASIVSRFLEDA